MANTYKLISSVTVGSGGAASIDFTSIPQTYTDLAVYISARGADSSARDYIMASINGVTTNRSWKWVAGYDSNVVTSSNSTNGTLAPVPCNTATANTFGNIWAYFPNYTSSNYKSYSADGVSENNSSTTWMNFILGGLWSSTAAITSLSFNVNTGNLMQHSTAYLYGINNS